jgi:sec-independent protein translocase protein TatA
MDLGPPELLIILAVVLLLFGGTKLPQLARSLGQAKKEFQDGANEGGRKADKSSEPKAVESKVTEPQVTTTKVTETTATENSA